MLVSLSQGMIFVQTCQRSIRILSAVTLLGFLSSCTQIQSFFQWTEVDLNLQVQSGQSGRYTLSGKANLPENTEITVAAIRYLQPEGAIVKPNPDPTYAILAYQPVVVKQGQWQTQLNLWEVAADGEFQEAWQREQDKLGLTLQPAPEVVFLATLAPSEELSALEQELAKRGIRFPNRSILSTTEGFRYAQAQHSMAVALPTGSTTPPPPRPEDDNDGWGDRYIIPQEPPNRVELELPEERRTDAPPRPEEFLN